MEAANAIPPEFIEWLESLHLAHKKEAACDWWNSNGAATLTEVFENWEDFAADLDLKPLERKRIGKDVACRSALATAGTVAEPTRHVVTTATPAKQRDDTFGPPEDPFRYTRLEEIGFGVTSRVYRCQTGQDVFAVKVISLKKLRRQPGFAQISERFHQEIKILLALRHKRVIKLVDVVDEHDCLYLVMELVQGGDLSEWIVKAGSFSELTARYVFLQMVEGLSYIHSKDIIHRDLKPDNVLVDETASKQDMLEVKLSDFGHSRLINDSYHHTLTARVGTAMYWAPEVSDPEKAALGYGQSSDIWSLGVVLYVMLIGFFPFDRKDHTEDQLECDVNSLRFQRRTSGPDLSKEAQDLIRSLLVIRPEDRLPLSQCFNHQWVAMSGEKMERMLGFMKLSTSPDAVEVRVPLTVKPSPDQLCELRCDLQQWMHKYKFYAAIRRDEVIANLGDGAQAPENKAARVELQAIVQRHCGGGMIVVNDQRMWTAIAEGKAFEVFNSELSEDGSKPVCAAGLGQAAALDERIHGRGVSRSSDQKTRGGIADSHVPGGKAASWWHASGRKGASCWKGKYKSNSEEGSSRYDWTPNEAEDFSTISNMSTNVPPLCSEGSTEVAVGAFNSIFRSTTDEERRHLAAIQGYWSADNSNKETYWVRGYAVVRTKIKPDGSAEDRNYTLRWNRDKQCLEWGTGKYVLLVPNSGLAMDKAVWELHDGVGRNGGFTWHRVSHGKAPRTSGKGRGAAKASKHPRGTFEHSLRIHKEYGAGLNLRTETNGMRIINIHPRPGQPGLQCEDLIQKVNDVPLSGTTKEVEEVFALHFLDGARLLVTRAM